MMSGRITVKYAMCCLKRDQSSAGQGRFENGPYSRMFCPNHHFSAGGDPKIDFK